MALKAEQLQEIADLRQIKSTTIRPVSEGLEEILYQPFEVLDHGFIRVVDYMGNDASVVQAARVSYGAGTKKVSADKALINYLLSHRHTTPFEMCEIKLHIKLPIFIARQWIRHRTASINEYSARYSLMEDEFYIPKAEVLSPQSKANHQGRDESKPLSLDQQKLVLDILKQDSSRCYENYLKMINQDQAGQVLDDSQEGLARELARINLPINCYTQWYWKIDLHNLLNFLFLRGDSHAQFEIRQYANIILDITKKWVPNCYNAFMQYRNQGKELSGLAIEVLKRKLQGEDVNQEKSGLSVREWSELVEIFSLDIS